MTRYIATFWREGETEATNHVEIETRWKSDAKKQAASRGVLYNTTGWHGGKFVGWTLAEWRPQLGKWVRFAHGDIKRP